MIFSRRRLVGIFGSVIKPLVPAMLDARHRLSTGHGIGAELVSDHDARRSALHLEELSHQPPCSLGVSAALHQHIEDEAILVDSPPQPMLCAGNADDDLVEVPFVTQATGRPAPDLVGEVAAEFLGPCPDRLVGDDDAAGRQHVLDHAQAEREAVVQPHRMRDDLSGKTVAVVERITGNLRHDP